MFRKTSAETYSRIKAGGLLSRRRLQVYEALYLHGPLTASELGRLMGLDGVWKRLPELRDLGVVAELGERECSVTGKTAIIWDVTDKLPADQPPRRRSPEREKTETIRQLKQSNQDLQHYLLYWKQRALTAEAKLSPPAS